MIIVTGSLNMDLVVNTGRIPRPGETVLGRQFKQVPGGKGGNQAAAAARLGAEVMMLGCVGHDSMGTALIESLQRDGVDTRHILVKKDAATGIAAITVEDSGNNAITVAPGANSCLLEGDIEAEEVLFQSSDILLTQLETPIETVKKALQTAKKYGKLTILNPAPAVPLDPEFFLYTDILTPNETELEILSGSKTDTMEQTVEAAKKMVEMGVRQLIVTLGEKGCLYVDAAKSVRYESYPVKAVDTTAAGDSFNGALAVCLAEGCTMEEAIPFAAAVGALTVTKEGAQTSLPTKEEVSEFLRKTQKRCGR